MAGAESRTDGANGRRDVVTATTVAHWLRERIREGRVSPGQRLIEADLTRETGASRSRVREALQRLESEGLVIIEEFRGASVRAFAPAEIRQIYRTRMALEGLAAFDFAAGDEPVRKADLARLQDELNSCEHTGDHRRFARLNDSWHAMIMDGAGNPYIRTFVDRLRLPLYQLLFSTFYSANRIDDANAGHRHITQAIVEGRAEDAERLMREHIHEALGAIVELERERSS
jgi:DNA-binding GntR family transcriptional regulator